jgi:hypothetical protein
MNWQIFGIVGWFFVLLGWSLQRPSVQNKLSSFTFQIGSGNQSTVSQNLSEQADSNSSKGDSPLSMIGSWASLVGLALTIVPLFK